MILATIVFILISNLLIIFDLAGIAPESLYLVPSYIVLSILLIFCLICPSFKRLPTRSLKNTQRGTALLIEFLITCVADAIFLSAFLIMEGWDYNERIVITTIIIDIVVGNLVFWTGIIRVYTTSKQLGLKWRLIGIFCGMIPVLHLIALGYILSITTREYKFEAARIARDEARKDEQICKTRYPILMVHGVFFRDFRYFNYWGRVPEALEANGATCFYGDQQSADSVVCCGRQIAEKVKQIVRETGCEKVNIIAHSKGGLDSRYAIAHCGIAPMVASLTTVNTPHRGCKFAEYILEKAPAGLKDTVANNYNAALKKAGDISPDFIAAVTDLTASACAKFNQECPDVPGVYYQSMGSVAKSAAGGRFPLNMSYHLVKYFDGDNDGLVSLPSMEWGSNFIVCRPSKKRGVTHGDVIDLYRENIDGYDVRETYVFVVADLKKKGF